MSEMKILIIATAIFSFLLIVANSQNDTKFKTFKQEYNTFNESHRPILDIEKPATINNDALQLTPDSASRDFNLTFLSGRILLNRRFKLWDDVGNVASFNTSFLINIYRPFNETPGEGLAFLIAPDLTKPENSFGQFLGLTNSSTDGDPAYQIVAVEIDTFKQDFDPDDNHVGININSVNSTKIQSLNPYNITIAPIGAKFYNIWIDYDGFNKTLQVFIAEQGTKTGPTPLKPTSPILSSDLNLRQHVNQNSYFGFSASTGSTVELNCVLRWNLTVNHFSEEESDWVKTVVGIGVSVVAVVMIGGVALGYWVYRRRMARSNPNLLGALQSLPGTVGSVSSRVHRQRKV